MPKRPILILCTIVTKNKTGQAPMLFCRRVKVKLILIFADTLRYCKRQQTLMFSRCRNGTFVLKHVRVK
ncbi:MAG: hypothetical protein LBT89_00120 [Planctomycetaceae bacterium]|nr:hypothetical protein [Planctomycetaceae bacterium]